MVWCNIPIPAIDQYPFLEFPFRYAFHSGIPSFIRFFTLINVYSLPIYTHEKLNECNDMAKAVKEKNLRKRHFTYESVSNAFDKETADRVFPQVKNKPVKAVDEYLLGAIRYLIDTNGYTTQKTVEIYYAENGKYFDEMKYIKQLPAILQRLDLKKIKASKHLKEKYNILSAGYPHLLIKQGDV